MSYDRPEKHICESWLAMTKKMWFWLVTIVIVVVTIAAYIQWHQEQERKQVVNDMFEDLIGYTYSEQC